MQGMSSVEWASYMRESLGVRLDRRQLIDGVLEQLLAEYAHGLPLLPGARDAVVRLAQRWPLGLASSSNRIVIDRVLELGALTAVFAATVSSEEVPRGKPSPDVYLEAARRLGRAPSKCAAVEDSANGIRAAVAAQAAVVAVPNREFRPPDDVLGTADLVIETLSELTVERLERLSPRGPLPR
jgi:HAD superfamily hydrolase (TIGR01509 family)